MKKIHALLPLICTVAILVIAAGCASTPSRKNTLTAAGFKIIVPKNAKQEARLQTLPPGKLTPVMKNGKTYYVYPDAAHNQAYVGGPKEYNYYKVLRSEQKVANENLLDANENQPISSDLNWSSDGNWGGNGF